MSDERRSCSVMAWLLLSWAIAALALTMAVVSCVATPRPAPQTPAGFGAEITVGRTGAPHEDSRVLPLSGRFRQADKLGGAPNLPGRSPSGGLAGLAPVVASAASESPDASSSGLASVPAPRTGTPADFTSQGSIAWAAPRYGPLYLALPEPRGTVAIVCGPAGCVTRTSTDFGPDQRTYPDRIADVSAADFPVICGVPLSFGRCPGSVTILSRPTLPETDQ